MANFYEVYTEVQNYIGDSSSTTLPLIKAQIRGKVDELLQSGFMMFAFRATTITTTSGTAEYYLPVDCDRIIDITQRSTPVKLVPLIMERYDACFPAPTRRTGVPKAYMGILEDRVSGQPTVSSKVVAYSSSNQDLAGLTGATAFTIHGVTGGDEVNDLISLSATNVISSTNSYTKLYAITPNLPPVGNLRFTQATVGTTLVNLKIGETSRTFKKVQFDPIPDGSYTLYMRYQAGQIPLVNDSDPVLIPERYNDALVNAVVGEMLLRQGDAKAASYIGLATQALDRLKKEQDLLYDMTPRVTGPESPYIDYTSPFIQI